MYYKSHNFKESNIKSISFIYDDYININDIINLKKINFNSITLETKDGRKFAQCVDPFGSEYESIVYIEDENDIINIIKKIAKIKYIDNLLGINLFNKRYLLEIIGKSRIEKKPILELIIL